MIKCHKEHHLLTAKDQAPFTQIDVSQDTSPVVLVCDHASRYVPIKLNNLGIDAHYFDQHIGHDIGAAQVTQKISRQIGASAILAGFSRLVVDANRYLTAHDSMPAVSDGVVISGNEALSQLDNLLRVEELFVPYHDAINRAIAIRCQIFSLPIIFSVHSFTPILNGHARPWDIGLVWEGDNPVASLLMDYLSTNSDYNIGENEPYHACDPVGYTIKTHAESKGLPHCMVEIRQDLIHNEAGQDEFARVLSAALDYIWLNCKESIYKL